jgi:hypothetical protein
MMIYHHAHHTGLPEDDVGASKHVGVLPVYKIMLIYICCAVVDLDNKLYKIHSTNIKINHNINSYFMQNYEIFQAFHHMSSFLSY